MPLIPLLLLEDAIYLFAKLLGVRHRVSLQVDQLGMSPVLLTFVAQSGREAAFIIPS